MPEPKPSWLSIWLLLSPTRRYIERKKWAMEPEAKRAALIDWNRNWLLAEISLAALLLIWSRTQEESLALLLSLGLLSIVATWRIVEVIFAFWTDSIDKLEGRVDTSSLTAADRLHLLARSGVGIVFWFAVLYFLGNNPDGFKCPLEGFDQAMYFSALTFLSLGQEGQEVNSWPLRVLQIAQATSGFIVLVVALSIYLGQKRDA